MVNMLEFTLPNTRWIAEPSVETLRPAPFGYALVSPRQLVFCFLCLFYAARDVETYFPKKNVVFRKTTSPPIHPKRTPALRPGPSARGQLDPRYMVIVCIHCTQIYIDKDELTAAIKKIATM